MEMTPSWQTRSSCRTRACWPMGLEVVLLLMCWDHRLSWLQALHAPHVEPAGLVVSGHLHPAAAALMRVTAWGCPSLW